MMRIRRWGAWSVMVGTAEVIDYNIVAQKMRRSRNEKLHELKKAKIALYCTIVN